MEKKVFENLSASPSIDEFLLDLGPKEKQRFYGEIISAI
jgi:hypothetical protein